jgi:hypothetical protein
VSPARGILALAAAAGAVLALPASASALTVSVDPVTGAIFATDDAGRADDIGLGNLNGRIQIADRLSAITPVAPCHQGITPTTAECPQMDPLAVNIRFDTGGGDDLVSLHGIKVTRGTGVVVAGPGDDRVGGGALRDFLHGGPGNDTISGGANHDVIYGEVGRDLLSGNKGDDVIAGNAGNDRLSGGPGRARLIGGGGNDICVGGPGRPKLISCENGR